MSHYQTRSADHRFILEAVLKAPDQLQSLPRYAEVDADLLFQVVDGFAEFVTDVVAPLNTVGDAVGAQHRLEEGVGRVTMPPGFRAAYRAFWEAGWPALHCDPEDGGQGLPAVLEAVLYETLSAANHGWTMAPGLLHGAYACLRGYGSAALKAAYLPKLATGEWLATMCLTEPQAGSDLGLVSTRAVPLDDGSYAITGNKIFISGGDHDLTENIVHLVLARVPDAPPGPKGLSLFLVPKWYADGRRSAVYCDRIEEKMGLHGSPTCAMRFDAAQGWLVGELGKGLNAMFVMMNAARLHVALQGIGLLDLAWQKADAYAQERRQMRAPGQSAAAGPSFISQHPAMRRILDVQRAWVDCGRVLAYTTAVALDVQEHHADVARRASAQSWCSLVTPVLKAAFTQQAFYGASECLQVLGGHGYISEWGIEQVVRDARVAMIYEGTNEIQAIDLLVRKVLPDHGAALSALLQGLAEELPGSVLNHPVAGTYCKMAQRLQALTARLCAAAGTQAVLPYSVADDYLRLVAMALLAWASARIEAAAETLSDAEALRWRPPQQALQRWVLPEFDLRCGIIEEQLA